MKQRRKDNHNRQRAVRRELEPAPAMPPADSVHQFGGQQQITINPTPPGVANGSGAFGGQLAVQANMQMPPPVVPQHQLMMAAPLPPGWEARMDTDTQKLYYIDHNTQMTQWYPPPMSPGPEPEPEPAAVVAPPVQLGPSREERRQFNANVEKLKHKIAHDEATLAMLIR